MFLTYFRNAKFTMDQKRFTGSKIDKVIQKGELSQLFKNRS